jgi:hypothetical protein
MSTYNDKTVPPVFFYYPRHNYYEEDGAIMAQIFECLRCGHLSTLTAVPVRCGFCDGGSGIIRDREARDNPEFLDAPKPGAESSGSSTSE